MAISIRRALITSSLLLGATAALSPAAFAGTTDDVEIGGTVTSTLAIDAGTGKTDLNLAAGQDDTAVKVADLTMGTNEASGLTLTTSGTFSLVNADAQTPINFEVGVGVGTAAPTTYGASGAAASGYITSAAAPVSTPYGLWIKYDTAASQHPADYDATISLTVQDN